MKSLILFVMLCLSIFVTQTHCSNIGLKKLKFLSVQGSPKSLRDKASQLLENQDDLCFAKKGNRFIIADKKWILYKDRFYTNKVRGCEEAKFLSATNWAVFNNGKYQTRQGVFRDTSTINQTKTQIKTSKHISKNAPATIPSPNQHSDFLPVPKIDSSTTRFVTTGPIQVIQTTLIKYPFQPQKTQRFTHGTVNCGRENILLEILFNQQVKKLPAVTLTSQSQTINAMIQEQQSPYLKTWLIPLFYGNENDGTYQISIDFEKQAPIQSNINLLVDTVPPKLKTLDSNEPNEFQANPYPAQKLARHEFPKQIRLFLEDSANENNNQSGIDWESTSKPNGLNITLRSPSGKNIPGINANQPPSLVLLLPDVFDPDSNVFEDTDGDYYPDPEEGAYTVQYTLIDKAGNQTQGSYQFYLDTTPIAGTELNIEFEPITVSMQSADGVWLNKLEKLIIRSNNQDFDYKYSKVILKSRLHGPGTISDEVKTTQAVYDDRIEIHVNEDQNEDGKPDFINPEPGQYLPPGMQDPRWGRNDGVYILEVNAKDKQGNESNFEREFVIDTTKPELVASFPGMPHTTSVTGSLRIIDISITDQEANSGHNGSGISEMNGNISLYFTGPEKQFKKRVKALLYFHKPNHSDPTKPDFNPNDLHHRLLIEFVDTQGQTSSLPMDGSGDGWYVAEFWFTDKAGNEHKGEIEFLYSSKTSEITYQELRTIY